MASSTYEIHAWRRNFVWRLDQLLLAEGRRDARELVDSAEEFVNNFRVLEVLIAVSQMRRDTFKNISNEGYVYVRSKPLDLGNYVYTVLYEASFRVAKILEAPALQGFQALQERYASLALHHPPSHTSVEMKADVVEAVLADSRLTGACPELRSARMNIQATLRKFRAAFERLLRRITGKQDGMPCVAAFPPPTMLCKLLFAAVGNTEQSRKILEDISALILAERPWTYEVGPWKILVSYAYLNQSRAPADHFAESLPPATSWQVFLQPLTHKKWYWNEKSGEFFFEEEPGNWKRYLDEAGRTWWHNSSSAEWFHDI